MAYLKRAGGADAADFALGPELGAFLTCDSSGSDVIPTALVVLTRREKDAVSRLLAALGETQPIIRGSIQSRLADLANLAEAVARFPPLLGKRPMPGGETLTHSLLRRREGDRTLYLPAKAAMGKGFIVAKFQLFMLMTDIAGKLGVSAADEAELRAAVSALLFTLMAEDVYVDLLESGENPEEVRLQAAMALILLWDHRADFVAKDTAPVLQAVWDARFKLAPVFGSMMGASELMQLSMELEADAAWSAFLSESLEEESVQSALEEFLFALSYEQITRLRALMAERGVSVIDRAGIGAFLGKDVNEGSNSDPREFYMRYTLRRDNARARKRLGLPGPRNTLEDYFLRFALGAYKNKATHVEGFHPPSLH